MIERAVSLLYRLAIERQLLIAVVHINSSRQTIPQPSDTFTVYAIFMEKYFQNFAISRLSGRTTLSRYFNINIL